MTGSCFRPYRLLIWVVSLGFVAASASLGFCADDVYDPHLRSLRDYLAQATLQDPLLGVTLRPDRRLLKSGASAAGLLIVNVKKGSPAANAGLVAVRKMPKDVLSGMVVVGAMAFPPAIMLLPLTNSLPDAIGGDLIIAADGFRVRNYLDYESKIGQAQPGEIVYLTIVRGGVRKQVAVPIRATAD
jgi:S1-C subfamily serine protease